MIKTILKESIIIVLLCVAILLVLSILFYDYNPISKVVPNKIAYSAPENIKEELEEETIKNTLEMQNKVYTIEGSDLNIYKKSKTYDPSKVNPFASTTSESTNSTNTDNKVNNINNTNNINSNTQTTNTINQDGNKNGLK